MSHTFYPKRTDSDFDNALDREAFAISLRMHTYTEGGGTTYEGLKNIQTNVFIQIWHDLFLRYPGLHPNDLYKSKNEWPPELKPWAIEAFNRYKKGEMSKKKMYPSTIGGKDTSKKKTSKIKIKRVPQLKCLQHCPIKFLIGQKVYVKEYNCFGIIENIFMARGHSTLTPYRLAYALHILKKSNIKSAWYSKSDLALVDSNPIPGLVELNKYKIEQCKKDNDENPR
jgi:hypothetical protein